MKHVVCKLLSITVLLSTAIHSATDNCCCVASHLSFRSQGENAARELADSTKHVNLHNMDRFYSSLCVTPEYTRSFSPSKIAQCLFGCDLQGCDCHEIYVRGSSVDRNDNKDWLSTWFFLPQDYQSNLCFKPVVQNYMVDLNLYLGLDEWCPGLFFRMHTPITHTKWDLNAYEDTKITSTNTLRPVDGGRLVTSLSSFFDYACLGKTPATQTVGEATYAFQPLRYGKICPCERDKTGLADIHMDMGWNLTRDRWHVGFFGRLVAPTGNHPNSEYLFEPVVGNGGHWEFGGGITTHATIFEKPEENRCVSFFADMHLTHLFGRKQRRSFDLKDQGSLSRYMFARREVGENGFEYAPIANLTRCTVNVSAAVQADIVAMINYFHNNFTLDIGYNLWARSCEKFGCPQCDCCNSSCQELDGTTWFIAEDSTIHSIGTGDQHYLTEDDLNRAGTSGLSNKVFTNFGYHWIDSFARAVPYVGAGMEVEFGSSHGKNSDDCCNSSCCSTSDCDDTCSTCCRCSLSQWGIWLKGGFSF